MKVMLPDEQRPKILSFLRTCPNVYVGKEAECRRYLEVVLWIVHSGTQWRLLPDIYGNWNGVFRPFTRWCDRVIWERMLTQFTQDPDMEHLILDSTVVRTRPYAADAPKKTADNKLKRLGATDADSAQNPCEYLRIGKPFAFDLDHWTTA